MKQRQKTAFPTFCEDLVRFVQAALNAKIDRIDFHIKGQIYTLKVYDIGDGFTGVKVINPNGVVCEHGINETAFFLDMHDIDTDMLDTLAEMWSTDNTMPM